MNALKLTVSLLLIKCQMELIYIYRILLHIFFLQVQNILYCFSLKNSIVISKHRVFSPLENKLIIIFNSATIFARLQTLTTIPRNKLQTKKML